MIVQADFILGPAASDFAIDSSTDENNVDDEISSSSSSSAAAANGGGDDDASRARNGNRDDRSKKSFMELAIEQLEGNDDNYAKKDSYTFAVVPKRINSP